MHFDKMFRVTCALVRLLLELLDALLNKHQ